ncbi:MAG TPA: potassium transporter [Gammaproteobacteria bacterium]|nr:potassium transporter [Gammaproteobacteria bacterium]
MEHGLVTQLLIVLAVGTLLVALCQRFGLSPILGYLATGVLVGPSALGWLPDDDTTRLLAELGVVLLMFTIGLEFSLPRLLAARRLVLGLGGAQVVLSGALFMLLAWWLGRSPAEAFVLGGALAMSSTAIVLKQLGEQMELPAPHGRVVTGILLFQDIAAVPLLVVLPILAADPARLGGELSLALAKAALVFLGLVFVGRRLLPPLLHWVAQTRSLELFMLTALLLALSSAGVSAMAGLSPTLGAFMAGMLLGETMFRHQIEADIRPFRDLMLGLFFATIGMQLDPRTFVTAPLAVALVVAALVVLKPLLLAPLVRAFGHTPLDAWRSAIALAQGGEFGLLLISTALASGLFGRALAQPVLGGLILSMVLAPLLLRFNGWLAARLTPRRHLSASYDVEAHIADESSDYQEHVIVCGYGRVGQNLVRVLEDEGIQALALDLDPERVAQAAAAGEPVLFGNAIQPGVLRAAGIERARALAVTIDDAVLAEHIVGHARALAAGLPILVRSTHGHADEALVEAGAEVFPEGLEASLAFAGQLLIMLDVPPARVEERLNSIRAQDYAPLRVFFHDTAESQSGADARDYPEQVRALIVAEGYHAVGRTPLELGLPDCEVELLGVRRGALRLPGRLLDVRLRPGDVLLLKGSHEALERAMARLMRGA